MNNLITLAMIVKNEEFFLPQCLESVKGIVDDMVIVDTGSTDKTIEIAESFGARVIQIPWPNDFAKARNVGLDAVKTPWVLVMDADEELVKEDLPILEKAIQMPQADAYNIRIVSVMDRAEDISESYVTRLFRSHPGVRFEGSIHEQVYYSLERNRQHLESLSVRFIHKGYLGSIITGRNKIDRNLHLMENHVKNNPDDGYMLWQLAQTYDSIGRHSEAVSSCQRSLKCLGPQSPIRVLVWTTYAKSTAHAGHPKKALGILSQALGIYPTYTDFRYLQGTILLQLGQWQNAEDAFNDCLRMGEPKGFLLTETGVGGFKALFKLAETHIAQQHTQKGLAHLLMAIRNQPTYHSAWSAVTQLLAGTPLEDLYRTFCMAVPRETIIHTLSSWPTLTDDETLLLNYAKNAISYPATQQNQ